MGKIESVLMCQRAYRIGFGGAVEQITLEPAGVDTVDVLSRGTQRAGQSLAAQR